MFVDNIIKTQNKIVLKLKILKTICLLIKSPLHSHRSSSHERIPPMKHTIHFFENYTTSS